MAPLRSALVTAHKSQNGGVDVYSGAVDGEWVIKGVPNGGYVLGLAIQACTQRQASTSHPDIIHLTGHFLQAASPAPIDVHISVLKTGKQFTNLSASLVQQGKSRITTHIIFGSLAPSVGLGIPPNSPYARRHPLHVHPSKAIETRTVPRWGFAKHVRWSRDPFLHSQNFPDSLTRTNSETVGGGGLFWGVWFQLTDPEATITPAVISLIADTIINSPLLLPKEERGGTPSDMWFATLTMALEYKCPIPPPSADHAARTVGVFSSGTFWGEPSGRHDVYVEIWTAPAELGDSRPVDPDWRDKQLCLATSTQMALCISARPEAKTKL
ncbi:hypothetical protein MIND_00816300 [Mycena indigotica]|uniref:Acyl-CoA thioesterase-like N-terminal HotDog domain-containing protein n=1 Tax=Mycena indigotica TaxID=2126181 RepID=A0A8H6SHB5_9AGAR|nr:uncharacterized protein MIND_00816300 [Mycena indigotica]KAF7298691.1 hypothetical protein MIND_00816300 [Mycena indigotica]